jgi:transporter family protein
MHLAPWLIYTILALICFGLGGLLQKLSTDRVSAESALVWLVVGFLVLQPLVYPGRTALQYSARSILFVLLAGVLNALGSWAVLAAMKSGGKASIVVPLTAVYPMVVCVLSPILLQEHITAMQGVGIACGMGAIFLLAS